MHIYTDSPNNAQERWYIFVTESALKRYQDDMSIYRIPMLQIDKK